jgi:hypothetical protein
MRESTTDNNFYLKKDYQDMKVENWDDLFKYNNDLINDDYNHGQALVIKTKAKASDNVTVSRQRH